MQGNSKENHSVGADAYRFGLFELIPSERELRKSGKRVALQPKVFDALLLFVGNAERLVRRDELIETLWPNTYVTDTNLTNIIVTLRKVLGREAIQTVSKFGYRFCVPVVGEPGIRAATYAIFVEAKGLAAARSLESMARARDLFSLCVAQDPAFAAAWAWLGRCARFLDKFTTESSVNLDLADAALRRALAIDPHLACAHYFYTQLQIDLGQSTAAAARLVDRILTRGDEPESYAGLVHALRFCGLLAESVAAHDRASELDPTVVTSVTHTHFLRCEYGATLDSYRGTRYYLDAAAWAALGDITRAIELLRERLSAGHLSTLMAGLMNSMVATLTGQRDAALAAMRALTVTREPEVLFYLARHFAILDAHSECVAMLRHARAEGLTASYTMAHDEAFERVRPTNAFADEFAEARRVEAAANRELERVGIGRLFRADPPATSRKRREPGRE
jgi:DNA-binding winged helix-turn-helix (wHTH) protein